MSDWFYAANNEQKGPINESELKADIAANKIPADALVWKDGMDNWTPANQLPAFSFRPAPAPAAIQPGAPAAASATPAPVTKVDASPEVHNPDSTKPIGIDDLKGMMGKPEALEVDAEDAEAHKIFGILAYLGPLCFLPLISAPQSPYARYHANQGFTVFLFWIIIAIALAIIDTVLHTVGLFALDWILSLAYVAPIGLMIFGIINAAAGKCVPVPVIGGIKLLKQNTTPTP